MKRNYRFAIFLIFILVNNGVCDQEFKDMVMRKLEEQDTKIQKLQVQNAELKSKNQIFETKLEAVKIQFHNSLANTESKMDGHVEKWNETILETHQKLSNSEELTNAQWVILSFFVEKRYLLYFL